MFGTLHGGCSFGALAVINLTDPDDTRFYSALAVNNTYCLTLSKKKMLSIVDNFEKRTLNDRREFMRSMQEFKDMSHTWLTKLILPECFELIQVIKGSVVFKEDEEMEYVYFIKEGDFEISKVITMDSTEPEDSAPMIMNLAREFPEPGRITTQIKTKNQKQPKVNYKQHVFGILSQGNYVGLMEYLYMKSDFYYTTMTCKSQTGGKLYRIKKAIFSHKMQNSERQMFLIQEKVESDFKRMKREVRKMKSSNV